MNTKKDPDRVATASPGKTLKGEPMSNPYFIKKTARSQVVVRVIEGIIDTALIIVGIAAVCYLASAVFRALGVG